MDKSQCFELGYIERSHGLDGSVVAVFDVDQPSYYRKIDALFLEKSNQLVPYLVRQVMPMNGNRVVLRLEGVENDVQAQVLKGTSLYLPDSALPPLKADQFYFHELIGAQVEDLKSGKLGLVSAIYEYPQQTLVGMSWQGAEILIPLHDDIIQNFDRAQKRVVTNLPDGLLNVYLQPNEPNEV